MEYIECANCEHNIVLVGSSGVCPKCGFQVEVKIAWFDKDGKRLEM